MLTTPSILFASLLLASTGLAQTPTKLLRFPDVHGDRVVFCYGGDLWLAPSGGGTATRLTAHEGLELFPKFSPDGQWVAFTGQYDGDEQVYVVPANGGAPKQLTWYPARGPLPQRWGFDNQVYGWSKDGQRVLFRSMSEGWDLTDTRLYFASIDGGLPVALPMPVSGGGDLSPDERRIAYSPLTRDFRTWKRYQGGWAQDLYVFDLATSAIEPIAHSVRTERDPMWIEGRIYFASDRDGTLNLFSYDTRSKQVEKHTTSTTWDVRWPSKGDAGQIVYEFDGELAILDTRSKKTTKLDIVVPDDELWSRPSTLAVGDDVRGFDLSPKGERALFWARGDVFTAPIEKGDARNLTRSSNAHDRGATWSPDGTQIAYLSDSTGEEEVWVVAQDGSTPARPLTSGGTLRRSGLRWSSDGQRISFSDASGRVWVLEVESRKLDEIARDRGGNVGDLQWAPDGDHLAFSLSDPTGLRSIWIWSASEAALHRVTDEHWNESEPVWDPKGRYLYYLSDREFAPQLDLLEWNFTVNRTTQVYALALRQDVAHPFPPQSDEVGAADAKEAEEKKAEEKKAEEEKAEEGDQPAAAPEPWKIEYEGLAERVTRVPIEAGNLNNLIANETTLFYAESGANYYGRESERKPNLMAFDIEERKPSVLVEGCGSYALSQDGKKLLASADGEFALYDATAKGKDSKKAVSTGGLSVDRVPKQEWSNAFQETWRRYRDYFYVPNLHGYDWEALRKQYAALLPHVAHRADLNYVLGEMVAELNVGHAYVSGGDWKTTPRPRVGLLGARFELDPQAQRYKIARILQGQNEEERYRSPLTEVGVDVKVGEYVLRIDGDELRAELSPYRLLRNKADRSVTLWVNSTPVLETARKVVVRPIASETDLVYLDWVLEKRRLVDRLSGGRLGYVHIPDMGADGIREFIKWFYGQVRKEGLIVDDRNNGGGNVSQMILERLRRVLSATGFSRHSDYTDTYPEVVFTGPMVCLLNENSASDGDIFPWMFRASKLGLLIGKRSWGGVVGITDHGPLIDGGSVSVPEFGHADAAGQWAVEGHGVDPDIVVENDPKSVIEGRDPQLERAVLELLTQLKAKPNKLPSRPEAPVKTR